MSDFSGFGYPYPFFVPPASASVANIDYSLALVTPSDTGVATVLSLAAGGRVQRSGDTMTGRLALAFDPVNNLDAATKQYVDGAPFRALGNTLSLTGATNLAYAINDPIVVNLTVNAETSSLGSAASHFVTTIEPLANGDGPVTDGYAMAAALFVNALSGSAATGGQSQHVSVVAGATRYAPPGGYPTGRFGAQMWSAWVYSADYSGQPSSTGGAMSGIEMDMYGSHADDTGSRYGIQFTLNADTDATRNPAGQFECARFLYVNGQNSPGNQTWFQSILQLYAPYTVAGIDMSQGSQDVGDPLQPPLYPNAAVAIKLRANQKYGYDGDGITGTYVTFDGVTKSWQFWNAGTVPLRIFTAATASQPAGAGIAAGLSTVGCFCAGPMNVTGNSTLVGVTAQSLDVSGATQLCTGGGAQFGVFINATAPRQTVTGSRGGNAALASLLTSLQNYGLIIDSTTA